MTALTPEEAREVRRIAEEAWPVIHKLRDPEFAYVFAPIAADLLERVRALLGEKEG